MTNNSLMKLGADEKNWTLVSWELCLERLKIRSDICFLGDSLTIGGEFSKYFAEKKICNLGIGGDTVSGMRRRVSMVAATEPSSVFVMGGINDLIQKISVEACLNEYRLLVSNIRELLPEAKIYVQSVLPINHGKCDKKVKKVKQTTILQFNSELEKICKENSASYIDLFSAYAKNNEMPSQYVRDGLHLTKESYDLWYKTIEKYVRME